MPEEEPKPAEAGGHPPRDPFVLVLVVLLIVAYAVGQWLTFAMLAEKLDAVEQRVVDTTARLDAKVEAVNETVVLAARALKAPDANPADTDATPGEADSSAVPDGAPVGSADAPQAASAAPAASASQPATASASPPVGARPAAGRP